MCACDQSNDQYNTPSVFASERHGLALALPELVTWLYSYTYTMVIQLFLYHGKTVIPLFVCG